MATLRDELGHEDYDRMARALQAEWRHQRSCLIAAQLDLASVRDLRFREFPACHIDAEDLS